MFDKCNIWVYSAEKILGNLLIEFASPSEYESFAIFILKAIDNSCTFLLNNASSFFEFPRDTTYYASDNRWGMFCSDVYDKTRFFSASSMNTEQLRKVYQSV